jgi:LacI family transcriptional regulator
MAPPSARGDGASRRGPTSHDVARRAGVAQSTVSRALSGDPNVSEETRLRVAAAAEELDYAPDLVARSLITRKSKRVGVVVSNITNPFYPHLVDVLKRDFAALGYSLLLFNEQDVDEQQNLLELYQGRAVDGFVFASAVIGFAAADRLHELAAPVVFLNRHIEDARFDCVVSDNRAGGRVAARHLVEMGHTRVAQIAGPPQTSTARERDDGFRSALAELGRPLAEELRLHGAYEHATGLRGCRELLAAADPPTAVFCGNDVIALGAWDAAISEGLSVPEDLSIVGFDDIEMASWDAIGMTTVRQPLTEMARVSAEFLVTRLSEDVPPRPRERVFETELIVRRTTGPAALS